MAARIRKVIVQVDETLTEMGRDVRPPVRKALAMAGIGVAIAVVAEVLLARLSPRPHGAPADPHGPGH